jgi:hypothetical protein
MSYPEFKNRVDFREWLQFQNPTTIKDYCKEKFLERKREKGLVYSMTQVELRTLPDVPNLNHLNKIFKDYYTFCYMLGFKNKHRKFSDLGAIEPIKSYNNTIYVDTREQKPLDIDCKVSSRALRFGDYTLDDKELSGNLYIERKSLSDLIGTISKGFERFEREILKSVECNAYLVILVEEDLSKALEFNKLAWINKFTKAQPYFIFHRIRELIQKYPTIQFLFVPGRREAARITKTILYQGKYLKDFDLQYLMDSNLL